MMMGKEKSGSGKNLNPGIVKTMAELSGKKLMVSVVLNLLFVGAIVFENVPEYYCDAEDKVARCVYVSASNATCTSVSSVKETGGEFTALDDRCQKGTKYGQWQPLSSFVEFPHQPREYFETTRPIMAWNVNYIRNADNSCYAKGECLVPLDSCETTQ